MAIRQLHLKQDLAFGRMSSRFFFFFSGSLTHFALENEVKGGFSLVAVQTWAVV